VSKQRILETRPATDSDEQFLWKLYEESVKPLMEKHIAGGWDSAAERTKFLSSVQLSGVHVLELDGQPIGWLGGEVGDTEAVLEHFYVEPGERGNGVGGTVFRELVDSWKAAGKTVKVSLHSDAKALDFVRRQGFVTAGGDQITETLQK
jgi:GNAT superfamily N-acetyltransferase